MPPSLEHVSGPARITGPDERISPEELHLAGRNHAMPLEALRHDVTPAGLHYVLTHYDIPEVDTTRWRLAVGGRVLRPLRLELDQLRSRPRHTITVTMECAGNGQAHLRPRPVGQPWLEGGVSTARWTGTPLAPLLRQAGLQPGTVEVVFTGCDHGVERGVEQDYARSLPLVEALRPEVLLAYEMNGRPLPPQHGAPLRLVVPGWYGMAHVKWLRAITVVDRPFTGYQQLTAYRITREPDEVEEPVRRIRPRALMVPPGFPDFATRHRVVDAGEVVLRGRAWSGTAPVVRVEVGVATGPDRPVRWHDAELGPQPEPHAWRPWWYRWRTGAPGDRVLTVCATDATGDTQPTEPEWNRQGMANNAVQRVPVLVRDRLAH